MKDVCVLGLGYIGLPTASILATQGFDVLGVDVSDFVVNKINSGNAHVEEPGLNAIVQGATGSGKLRAALEPEPADVFIIAVPTPLTEDKEADLSHVEKAARTLLPVLKKGDLVILESTVPPGTTEDVLAPILAESKLRIGEELFVAHCPERVLPGRILKELIENDRVIGGVNRASTEKAAELYRVFVEGEIFMTNSATAEMAKIIENTYRDVNIALANELAIICEKLKINAWEVIDLANKHPRVNLHSPGPGVGGHCISVDPWFIVSRFREEARLIETSRRINESMPRHIVGRILEITRAVEHPKVALLGLAYKGNVDDTRESPAQEIHSLLVESGVDTRVYDPHVKHSEVALSSLEDAFKDSDCAVLVTDHDEFKELNPTHLGGLMNAKVIFDTRDCLDPGVWRNAGFTFYLHGEGKAD